MNTLPFHRRHHGVNIYMTEVPHEPQDNTVLNLEAESHPPAIPEIQPQQLEVELILSLFSLFFL